MKPFRTVALAAAIVAAMPAPASAIPAWARRYNMNCSGCHLPTVPRLNRTGLRFKWAGYRMPDDIGEKVEVAKIDNYIAMRAIVEHSYARTQGAPADVSSTSASSASLYVAGPFGTNYGGFFEFERTPDGAVDLVGQVVGVWGKEDGFWGLRAGQGHMIVGGAVAGFDRPTGILAPLPLSSPVAQGVPFRLTGDIAGAEAFYVAGGFSRTSVQVVNSVTAGSGEEMSGPPATTQDFVLTNQLLWDDVGSGVTAVGYFGQVKGLSESKPDLSSRYTRFGISANKFAGPFEVQAGYVFGSNTSLPTGSGSEFSSSSLSGGGYWIGGAYIQPKTYWTSYGRFEFVDPNRDVAADGTSRVVFGSLLPVGAPEYLRVGLEYFLDSPEKAGDPRREGITLQLHVAF